MPNDKLKWKIGTGAGKKTEASEDEAGTESDCSNFNFNPNSNFNSNSYLNSNFIAQENYSANRNSKISFNNKRKNKIIFSVSIALIVTFIQLFLFNYLFYHRNNKSDFQQIALVVPRKNLKKGQILREDELTIKRMNVGVMTDEVLLAEEFENYIGQPLLIDADPKMPIFKFMIAGLQKNANAREKIPIGKRLFYLKIESDLSAKSLAVGDNVDVIAHMDIPDFGKATETVLEAVQIVGIGEGTGVGDVAVDGNSDLLSFFLSPEEVKIMTFMKSYGAFSVYLRNPNDFSKTKNGAITFNKFIENDRIKRIIGGDKFKIIQGINKNVDNNR